MDTLLLPLSWWDMFPHQLAHSNEDAWARGLQVTYRVSRAPALSVPRCGVVQVNVLAANTHSSAGWSSGSGLYSPSGHRAYTHNLQPGAGGSLLLADMDISPVKVGPQCTVKYFFIVFVL